VRIPDLAKFYTRNVPQRVQKEEILTKIAFMVSLSVVVHAEHIPVTLWIVLGLEETLLLSPTLQFSHL